MDRFQDVHDRPLTALVADLWRDSASLVRGEAALAKAEFQDKVSRIGTGIAWLAAGGVVLVASLIFLLLTLMTVLAMILPEDIAPWLAPLLVGAVTLAVGLLLITHGRRSLSADQLNPTQSARSVRKDVDLVKEHMP